MQPDTEARAATPRDKIELVPNCHSHVPFGALGFAASRGARLLRQLLGQSGHRARSMDR